MSEDGFGSAVMLALLALAGLLCLATADAANVLLARARAQAAADAAALAAAAAQWPFLSRDENPEDAASRMAEVNGATLDSCDCPTRGDQATVIVSVSTRIRMLGVAPRSVRARAEARMNLQEIFDPPS